MRAPLAVYTDLDDGDDPTPGMDLLRANGFQVDYAQSRDPDVIAAAARDATALLVGYAPIDEALLERLPKLRVISLLSNGSDNVDVEAASRRGIWVATVGPVASEEVATHAWALTLALIRRLPYFMRSGVEHPWDARPTEAPRRLSELTVGILGLGSIGRRYAEFASAAVRRVVAAERPGAAAVPGVGTAPYAEVLAVSDVLGVFLPLTKDTRGLLDASAYARMPRGAHVVNVSRGAVVDADALLAAVDSGHLAGAALDVFEQEPLPASHPLLEHPRVITTPHVGFLSDITDAEYVRRQADAVVTWRVNGRPDRAINRVAVRS
ncbi:C-terminal binding protein [Mycolicibacterium sp. 050158]|uniref:C-terminal binding protein n=1 Tax=Mycolicibacterium sp. 050158 TaxID=3090602 RepID=UPI00299DB4AA|nr:C-terminal binding protein [Mycolicibacterium sp. 050158]MDX1891551.1 C-terminal binding protein [Mycolicibacterium sp. 050158]